MRAYLLQTDIVWEDRAANHAAVHTAIEAACPEQGSLVVLPEMFATGFSMRVERTADTAGGDAALLASVAARYGVTAVGGTTVPPGQDGMARNRSLVYGPGGDMLAGYDKVHPFSFGREPERFAGGEWGVRIFAWGGLRVCPVICYDLRFPELFRAGVDAGAEAFVVVANWPEQRAAHWRTLLIARAVENQAYVFGVNRCGSDPALRYAGGSLIVAPEGDVLAEAGGGPCALCAAIDPEAVRAWRSTFPALRDRRR